MKLPLHEVEEFESQVAKMLDLLDYEYGSRKRDPEIDIPPALTETFRRCLVRSRGLPAIRELTEWVVGILGSKLPDEVLVQLYKAHDALLEGAESDTYNALEQAVLVTVSDIEYADLTLAEAVTLTCLVSKLVDLADHVVAGMSSDLSVRMNVVSPNPNIRDLASGQGELADLVDILARFFFIHRRMLPVPAAVTVQELRARIALTRRSGDLPGLVIALWAATNGHLATIGGAIGATLELMIAEYEKKRPFIEAELRIQ